MWDLNKKRNGQIFRLTVLLSPSPIPNSTMMFNALCWENTSNHTFTGSTIGFLAVVAGENCREKKKSNPK